MMKNNGNRAVGLSEAFLAWARRSAIPVAGSHEEPLSEKAQASLGRMLEGKLILMGHNGHLSKDVSKLRFQPQRSTFWGWRSWLRALGYEAFSRLTRCPLDIQDGSVGSHLHERFPGQVLSIWMLYGQGTLMMARGPRAVHLHGDTVESLLARVGDRFLLPLNDVDPQAKAILSHANLRSSWGYYASADLMAQADAVYFVRDVSADW